MLFFLEGVDITNQQFTHAGAIYPSNWCAVASPAALAEIGIVDMNEVWPELEEGQTYSGEYTDSVEVVDEVDVHTRTYAVVTVETVPDSTEEVITYTENAVLPLRDVVALIDATGGNVTLTLPDPAAAFNAETSMSVKYIVKRIDNTSNEGSVAGTIDGDAGGIQPAYNVRERIISNGVSWYTI